MHEPSLICTKNSQPLIISHPFVSKITVPGFGLNSGQLKSTHLCVWSWIYKIKRLCSYWSNASNRERSEQADGNRSSMMTVRLLLFRRNSECHKVEDSWSLWDGIISVVKEKMVNWWILKSKQCEIKVSKFTNHTNNINWMASMCHAIC